ncbi:MAG: aminotransferase class I/II-fold pyridoxal phosphate-dependent enzyme [Sphingobacterium sp.]|jgi:methionine aminotransferase|uniref:methionine aminotransferase n=1 Tax=Sphingobacterium sp. TaxID=341027 RepID=UPI002843FEE0|nr:methionine aminotransferase [Sphingobacterium sp.]MDR3011389.1 aminotransferase class I/II-fold pyridoxal phosphate-dependent enzyme [Sphingobacterium sp.]
MNFNLTSKLPHVGTTIFTKMTMLANAQQALNLSQGFPDFETDPKLVELVAKAMEKGYNQYAPMIGAQPLRDAIVKKYKEIYNVEVDATEELTITAGGTQAIFTAIATVVRPLDEVIIFEPAYDCYAPTIELFGGKVVPVRLLAPDFQIDWDYVATLINAKTRLIIINNPNNPTGKVLDREELIKLGTLLEGTSTLLLSDEVYEHIVFDGVLPQSVIGIPTLRERSFVIASFGKLLHTTGWKIGYCIAPALLTQEFRKVHQFNVFSVNTPMQFAIAEYLSDLSYVKGLPAFFEQKRNLLKDGLEESRFKILPCEGTYFLNIDYSAISEEKEFEFACLLTEQHKIATIPLSAFYKEVTNQQVLRVCFAKKDETLWKAVEILKKI